MNLTGGLYQCKAEDPFAVRRKTWLAAESSNIAVGDALGIPTKRRDHIDAAAITVRCKDDPAAVGGERRGVEIWVIRLTPPVKFNESPECP